MYHFFLIPSLSGYKIKGKYKNEEYIPLLSILWNNLYKHQNYLSHKIIWTRYFFGGKI